MTLAPKTTKPPLFVGVLLMLLGCGQPTAQAANAKPLILSTLKQLNDLMTTDGRIIANFRLEGVVCAVPDTNGAIVLQDESATVLLKLPPLNQSVKARDNLILEGTNCTLTCGPFGIQVGTAPVVDADGSHHAIHRSGKTFLDAGKVPLRVEWFNDYGSASLKIECEGPGMKRTNIPTSALFHRVKDQTQAAGPHFKQGLEYSSFVGNGWKSLPDFQRATKAATGVVTGFDIERRARPDQCAMMFTGFLQISNAGIYTFHVSSDDGCRLFAGDASAHCLVSVAARSPRTVKVNDLAETISDDGNQQWSQMEGQVNMVRTQPGFSELEIGLGQRTLTAIIINAEGLTSTNLIGASLRVTGILQHTEGWPDRLVVPGPEWMQILDDTNATVKRNELTAISKIRELSRDQARKHLRVRIRGIITDVTFSSCILQDSTGGIFLPCPDPNWVNRPRPGEVWEFSGVTDAGDFSPVVAPSNGKRLGQAALPQGVRPTWSDFQNGDLDADLVKIEAAVIGISNNAMALLTRDGTVILRGNIEHPLAKSPGQKTADSLLGSILSLRGVYYAAWNSTAKLVRPRLFQLGNASLSVIEPASTNWFLVPVTPIRDLLQFRSPTANWRHVKIAGVVLHSEPREYILSGKTGSIRVYTREPQPIHVGDSVEAAGYPQIGGPSPTLLEGEMRKMGSTALPKPIVSDTSSLPDRSNDARLVQIKALLLGDTMQQTERVLELQAGQNHFLAKLRLQPGAETTLRPGTLVQVTGVYSSLGSRESANGLDAFELLLNRPDNIVVLRQPSWWTPQRILTLAGILAVGLLLALAWAALLRRTVARRTLQLKQETKNRQLIEQQRVLEQERSRVAQDLHDELGARLAEVGILGTLANNPEISREKQQGYLHRLAELGRLLVSGLDEIVWAVNPRHDSNTAVSGYLRDYAQDFLHSADVACYIEDVQPWPDGLFTAQDRHQLFLAFQEALTNVVKHAQASEVWVRIGGDTKSFWVTVEDNGTGIPPGDFKGDGLINMKNRMKQIGGECEVKARSEGGTTVTFRVFNNRKPQSA